MHPCEGKGLWAESEWGGETRKWTLTPQAETANTAGSPPSYLPCLSAWVGEEGTGRHGKKWIFSIHCNKEIRTRRDAYGKVTGLQMLSLHLAGLFKKIRGFLPEYWTLLPLSVLITFQ